MRKGVVVWTSNALLVALLGLGAYFAFGSATVNWWGVGTVVLLTLAVCAVQLYLLYRRPERPDKRDSDQAS
ncbi:Na+-translocating ferredoxin:NAD+ oxidoreductase RnfE subunit [Kibdelosporangium phytohabitans]|uniref:Uncharacterized protein n=1 Tax=Kibdelosporangium phytohabitans TaxID=860235 RepID=A0A0N9I1L6_9PSEU|nr:hypothetical protein AOZ06_16670 [Kibdelosporangium phytohabitans]MBE1470643.1 Na+-translocating ferredoxin:NAD+ oxidoreductase RnfE subunit [Kibdelosporangium phytohabitans]